MGQRVREVVRLGDTWMLGILVLFAAVALTGCADPGVPSPNVPERA